MRLYLAVTAATLISGSAYADPAPSVPQAAAQAPKAKPADKDRIICETDEILGSLVPRRLCMTKSQWEEARDGAHRAIRDQAQDVEPRTQSGGN
jgi:hypothetical protein